MRRGRAIGRVGHPAEGVPLDGARAAPGRGGSIPFPVLNQAVEGPDERCEALRPVAGPGSVEKQEAEPDERRRRLAPAPATPRPGAGHASPRRRPGSLTNARHSSTTERARVVGPALARGGTGRGR
jgi:hypothetical protein